MSKKTKTIIAGITMIMLMGIVSAGLVDFLSNTVSGTINVQGPIFYVDSDNILSMNEEPAGGNIYTINGQEKELFVTEEGLGGIDFYKPEIEFVVDLEINNLSISRSIELEFGYINTDRNSRPICSVQYLSITQNGDLHVDCTSDNDNIEGIEEFYFSIEGMAEDDIEYTIKDKTSYVKITGVAPASAPSGGGT